MFLFCDHNAPGNSGPSFHFFSKNKVWNLTHLLSLRLGTCNTHFFPKDRRCFAFPFFIIYYYMPYNHMPLRMCLNLDIYVPAFHSHSRAPNRLRGYNQTFFKWVDAQRKALETRSARGFSPHQRLHWLVSRKEGGLREEPALHCRGSWRRSSQERADSLLAWGYKSPDLEVIYDDSAVVLELLNGVECLGEVIGGGIACTWVLPLLEDGLEYE